MRHRQVTCFYGAAAALLLMIVSCTVTPSVPEEPDVTGSDPAVSEDIIKTAKQTDDTPSEWSVPSSPAETMPETTSPESSGRDSADDNQTEGSQPSAPLPPVGHYGIASNPFHTLFQRLGAALAPFFTPDKGSALRRRVYEKIISSPESDLRNTISRLENRISQLEHTIDVFADRAVSVDEEMERQNEQIRELVNNAAGNRETIELLNSRVRERDNRISELSRELEVRRNLDSPDSTSVPPSGLNTLTDSSVSTDGQSGRSDDREQKDKHIYAVPRDVIAVSMSGQGWIFLGEEQGRSGIDFDSRKSTPRSTEFVFKASQKGEYTLLFQKQDNTRGVTNEQKIHVSVVDEARFKELINSFDGTFTGGISPEDEEKSYDTAEYHYREGREAEALEEYMKNYRPGDPQIDHRIATLSYNQGKWEQARRFWQKNSDEEGSYESLALDGLVRTAVQLKDSGLLNTVLPRLMENDAIPAAATLEEAARFLFSGNDLINCEPVLLKIAEGYPDYRNRDWALFTLGRLYEKAGPMRDLRKAGTYYRELLDNYPSSVYWDSAQERIRYIDANFIHIR